MERAHVRIRRPLPRFRGGPYGRRPWSRFPKPPYDPGRSDFPSPVLTLAFLRGPFRRRRGSSAGPHTPQPPSVYPSGSSLLRGSAFPGSASRRHPGTAKCPEPLCTAEALPPPRRRPAPPQEALPSLPRSYGLMRQTPSLPSPTVCALADGSWQVAASPCWERVLPDVVSTHLSPGAWALTPALPVVLLPVSSHGTTAFPMLQLGRHNAISHTATSVRDPISRLQPFLYVQAPGFARHSRSLPPRRLLPRHSGRGFYFRAEHGSLPSRASDMLTVRTGQLTAWGLSPHKMRGLVGRSCNIGVNCAAFCRWPYHTHPIPRCRNSTLLRS